jgi:hypothetical protein
MGYALGLLVWLGIAIVAFVVYRALLGRTPNTVPWVAFMLTLFGTFIGGMLGVAAYVYNDPNPLRFGGILGALVGAALFSGVYYWAARRLV